MRRKRRRRRIMVQIDMTLIKIRLFIVKFESNFLLIFTCFSHTIDGTCSKCILLLFCDISIASLWQMTWISQLFSILTTFCFLLSNNNKNNKTMDETKNFFLCNSTEILFQYFLSVTWKVFFLTSGSKSLGPFRQFCRFNFEFQEFIAELRRLAEPHTHHGKEKETHELIFSWLSRPAVFFVGACARRRRRSCPTWRPYSKKETQPGLPCTSLILDIHTIINWQLSKLNKVSADQYHITISRVQVYSSWR